MIRKIFLISAWCILLCQATAMAQTKVDPFLDITSETSRDMKASSLAASATASRPHGEQRPSLVEVFIKSLDPVATRASIEAAGGMVHTVIGHILTARIPAAQAQDIAAGHEVNFIEAGKPISLNNDVANGEINSNEVHAGTNLPAAYTGKGVVVGLIDTGIDYTHKDFLDANGKNRILAIWDQNRDGGPKPAEIENSFGTECAAASIQDGSCALRDFDGHGTHVAGTMAGRNDVYGGVAPDANIIAVVYDSSLSLDSGYADPIFSTKICQAAYYVFAKAGALGMPAVVNLSLGTHLGAHDGTSLFEECLGELTKNEGGRAIVAAAGNETSSDPVYTGIHAGYAVDGTSATNFAIRQTTSDRIYYIDIWGESGNALSFGLAFRDGGAPPALPKEVSALVAPGEQTSGSFLSGNIEWTINATESASSLNGKQHVGIRIVLNKKIQTPSQYSFDLVAKGKGAFDAWLFPDKPSKIVQFTAASGRQGGDWTLVPGDRIKSVAIPATSPDIIAVGGYTSRNRWESALLPDCCQVSFEVGNILDFSSAGPSAASAVTGPKPEIAAPGGMIASALSSDAKANSALVMDDLQHALQAGTSMAAPFVSGTVALMLSASPNYTQSDVERYIVESAYADDAVGDVPNDRWGYGKLDVLAAVDAALKGGASGHFDASGALPPPPSEVTDGATGGSSGCSIAAGTGEHAVASAMATLLGIALILGARRRQFKALERRNVAVLESV